MFFDQDLRGDRLPPQTLCLTYDDGPGATAGTGPGPRTLELGHYLFEQGIPATFFVVGQHVEQHPNVVRQLHEWGHLIASHTYSHAALVALAESGGDVVGEIERNHSLLGAYAVEGVTYFRAPYGSWRQKKSPDSTEDLPTSLVAALLNRSPARQTHVGPINWDISGHDYDYWRSGASAEECLAEYRERIETMGRGIVLQHDSSDDERLRIHNRTLEVTRLLVPFLRERGYRFVRLDAIPQVRSALGVTRLVTLRADYGRPLVWDEENDNLVLNRDPQGGREVFGVEPLGDNRAALRARNGLFVSVPPEGGPARAVAMSVSARETLEMTQHGGQVEFRTAVGQLLTSAESVCRFVLREHETSGPAT